MEKGWAVVVAALALIAPVSAMQKPVAAGTAEPKEDKNFIVKAVEGGLGEVALGRLAAQKGSTPQVKQFGEQMVADHTKSNAALQSLAATRHIVVPNEPDKQDRSMNARLEKLTGLQFDREYLTAMISDHAADVSEFEKETTDGRDPDVAKFASATLPTLEGHLKLAETTRLALESAQGR